jgi:hypothetical protein
MQGFPDRGSFVLVRHGPARARVLEPSATIVSLTGMVLSDLVAGRPPRIDLTPFRGSRFYSTSRPE